jgi:hypothetical protein
MQQPPLQKAKPVKQPQAVQLHQDDITSPPASPRMLSPRAVSSPFSFFLFISFSSFPLSFFPFSFVKPQLTVKLPQDDLVPIPLARSRPVSRD